MINNKHNILLSRRYLRMEPFLDRSNYYLFKRTRCLFKKEDFINTHSTIEKVKDRQKYVAKLLRESDFDE